MRAIELLQFINSPDGKFESTSRIAQKAKINHRTCKVLLMQLFNMPRPLVQMHEFGNGRPYCMWKQTKIRKGEIEAYLKIDPKDRDNNEHLVICQDVYGGNLHIYINSFIVEDK